mgnify:CR=1 FL=1
MALEIGEKMISLNLCFKLSKEFNSTDLNDILEEILRYRKSDKDHDGVHVYDPEKDLYSNFWDMVHQTDRPFIAQFGIGEFDGETWVDLNKS